MFTVGTLVRCHADCLGSPTEHRCIVGRLLRHKPGYDDGLWWEMEGERMEIIIHESEIEKENDGT